MGEFRISVHDCKHSVLVGAKIVLLDSPSCTAVVAIWQSARGWDSQASREEEFWQMTRLAREGDVRPRNMAELRDKIVVNTFVVIGMVTMLMLMVMAGPLLLGPDEPVLHRFRRWLDGDVHVGEDRRLTEDKLGGVEGWYFGPINEQISFTEKSRWPEGKI